MSRSRIKTVSLLAAAVLTCSLTALSTAHAQTLRIGGTGSATELMKRLGAAFEASQEEATVEVVPSLGSSGGIAAARDGALDIAISARPLKPDETGVIAVIAARTPYGLASSNPEPGNIAAADISAFYASTASTWPDGSPVRVILRPRSESDTALLGMTFQGMAEAIEQVRQRIEVPIAATDQDNLQMASDLGGSMVGMSLAQMVTEENNLRFLKIDGVEPTLQGLENGSYPYSKAYTIVYQTNPGPLVLRFLEFMRSSDGETLLASAGCLPAAP